MINLDTESHDSSLSSLRVSKHSNLAKMLISAVVEVEKGIKDRKKV